jgi:putative endonuclease
VRLPGLGNPCGKAWSGAVLGSVSVLACWQGRAFIQANKANFQLADVPVGRGKLLMTQAEPAPAQHWFVYVVSTARGMLYTGISTDPARRLIEHQSGARGARSLRGKGPLQLVFQWPAGSRSEAGRLEARIKKLDRQRKLQLVRAELDPAALLE